MKKIILFIVAMFAAVSLSARVVSIDLSQNNIVGEAVPVLNENELTVSYDLGEWGAGGVEFKLDNLDVTELAFDYKGDASVAEWVSFIVYLKDSEGGQWYSNEADLSISEWNADWTSKNFMPSDVLWESSTALAPVKPFVALGFLANPAAQTAATFAIRNVKLTVTGDEPGPGPEDAIDNVSVQREVVKVVRGGQVFFIRDDKTFNIFGAEVKKLNF